MPQADRSHRIKPAEMPLNSSLPGSAADQCSIGRSLRADGAHLSEADKTVPVRDIRLRDRHGCFSSLIIKHTRAFCNIIPQFVYISLDYIGRHTLIILCLHFLIFKFVSLFFIQITDSNNLLLASFPVIFNNSFILKASYTVFGVSVPIFLSYLCSKLYNCLFK